MTAPVHSPAPVASRFGVEVEAHAEALVFQGVTRPLERIGVPTVILRPGEVLAEVELAAICESDVRTTSGVRSAPLPLVLGHEQVGRIAALGPRGVRDVGGHPLSVGDRVVWGAAVDCGRCRSCHAGLPQRCSSLREYGHDRVSRGWELSGSFATHVQLLARTPIVRVPDGIPAEVLAPASCATATVAAVIEAASLIRPLAGSLVLVSGAGTLGLTAIAMCVAVGATVVAIDADPQQRELAARFGARETADGTRTGLASALRHIPAGRHGPVISLEVTGAASAVRDLLDVTDTGGVVVLAGRVAASASVPVDPGAVSGRMLTIRGVHGYAPRHLARAVEFLTGADAAARPFAELVGRQFGLADAEHAFALAGQRGGAQVGLRPGR